MRKSCENMAITWLRGGHHGLMVLLILENSKKIGNFGMVCIIAEKKWNSVDKSAIKTGSILSAYAKGQRVRVITCVKGG